MRYQSRNSNSNVPFSKIESSVITKCAYLKCNILSNMKYTHGNIRAMFSLSVVISSLILL